MNKLGNRTSKLMTTALILTITFLAACSPNTPVTACHATGDSTSPYEEIAINSANLKEHLGHPNDIYPVPEGGCPTNLVEISDDGNITICHATSSETDPYDEITVSVNGLDGHGKHAGDIVPVPEAGCPTSLLVISDGNITICHATDIETDPYDEITVSVNGLDGHGTHTGDIYPVPEGGCPTNLVEISDEGKITICHAASSDTNPYNEITVSVNGLDGHGKHAGDIIPAPESGCPPEPWETSDSKITICHATGSDTNPYNEISVSVNGLDGHDQHADDIIPVPEAGCPTTSP